MQGKFPVMLFGLPAAGAAMIMAAKKENREVAISIIGAAAVTSFLTGITEPIEFTFIFLAPALYYGFHCVMAALSFMSLDLLHSHIGMTFSGGIIDYALFGILPDAVGMHSNCY
jgi:PTS system glucose-specific IIC component